MNHEGYFWHAYKHGSVLQVDAIVGGHAESTQNKFVYPCNISRKTWGELDFLLVDKRESSLQVYSMTLGVCSQVSSKYPK